MKFSKFRIRIMTLLLAAALVGVSANAQESTKVKSETTHIKDADSLGSAIALLTPPDTSSPRATLQSFIENINRGYGVLMAAHRKNTKAPGFFASNSVQQMVQHAEELFERGVDCLNLSQVPRTHKRNVGYEGAIMLKEIFDRIELPPFEKIPDAGAIEAEKDQDKIAELSRWRIP